MIEPTVKSADVAVSPAKKEEGWWETVKVIIEALLIALVAKPSGVTRAVVTRRFFSAPDVSMARTQLGCAPSGLSPIFRSPPISNIQTCSQAG